VIKQFHSVSPGLQHCRAAAIYWHIQLSFSNRATLSRQVGKSLQYFATYTFKQKRWERLPSTNRTGFGRDRFLLILVGQKGLGALLPFDRTHIFNVSRNNYYFPSATKGLFWPEQQGLRRRPFFNGWQMSGITTIQSGNARSTQILW